MPEFDRAMEMIRLSGVKLRGVDQTALAFRSDAEIVAVLCAMQGMSRCEVRATIDAVQTSWEAESEA